MRYIFVDTNLLIHFQPIDEIDWSEFFQEKEHNFLIPLTVVQELDMHKYSDKSFLQKRSKKVLSRLKRIESRNENLPQDLKINILTEEPSNDLYEENNLNAQIPDERILANILSFQKDNRTSDVSFLTGDFASRLRAKKHNINVVELPDKYRIPSTESEEVKKIKRLERENKRLKNKLPEIDLSFSNEEKFKRFTIHKPFEFDEEWIDKKMDEVKLKNPKMENRDKQKPWHPVTGKHIITLDSLEKSPQEFNKEIDDFYEDYRKYIANRFLYIQLKRISFELELIVKNSGTVPAEDLDIQLHFPDGFEIHKELPLQKPNKPDPPSRYKRIGISDQYLGSGIDSLKFPQPSNVGNLNIFKSNSYDVRINIRKVKHNQSEALKTIIVLFLQKHEVKGFTIDYKIDVENYPEQIEGQLNLDVVEV